MVAFKWGGGGRRGGEVGRLIEGGGVGRPAGKNLQILALHRLASLQVWVKSNYMIMKMLVSLNDRKTGVPRENLESKGIQPMPHLNSVYKMYIDQSIGRDELLLQSTI